MAHARALEDVDLYSGSDGFHVAIIGGGIAGCCAALELSQHKIPCTLIEKKGELIDGPPWCHIHAGGSFYREIDDSQCFQLLEESIYAMRRFPLAVNRRPTVIIVPKKDPGSLGSVIARMKRVQSRYAELIAEDPLNEVMGPAKDYFKIFGKDQLEALSILETPEEPKTHDEWMIGVSKLVDHEKMKYPFILVQEYGWLFLRVSAMMTEFLDHLQVCNVRMNTTVFDIQRGQSGGFDLKTISPNGKDEIKADYLINACGFESGWVDDKLDTARTRMLEYKASYVVKIDDSRMADIALPEILFHGSRGESGALAGMAQLTSYTDGVFQLHGMNENITLFKNGLVKSSNQSSQPTLPFKFISNISNGWDATTATQRSNLAIAHMSQYIPLFHSARPAALPLHGAQQIAGKDKSRRAFPGSLVGKDYARIEIVKASSAPTMAATIMEQIADIRPDLFPESGYQRQIEIEIPERVSLDAVIDAAKQIAKRRELPLQLCEDTLSYADFE